MACSAHTEGHAVNNDAEGMHRLVAKQGAGLHC